MRIIITCILLMCNILFSQDNLEGETKSFNENVIDLRKQLKKKFQEVDILYQKNASEEEFEKLLIDIKKLKTSIADMQEKWREEKTENSMRKEDGYAFWDLGETTLSQLIMEYGSYDYLYVIPHDISLMKINMFSTIPIPRESWSEMLELILLQNGVGIKKLNPYLRQLYVIKHDPSYVEAIINSQEELEFVDDNAWVCYILSPPVEKVRSVQNFFERFSDIRQTSFHVVGSNIVIIAAKGSVIRLLSLYDALFEKNKGRCVKMIGLSKINPQEAEKILKLFFQDNVHKARSGYYQNYQEELSIVVQGSSIVLVGDSAVVEKSEKIINDLEKQIDNCDEMSTFWYTCKYADPEDLVNILDQVYGSLSKPKENKENSETEKEESSKGIKNAFSIKSPFAENKKSIKSMGKGSNFIVAPKTGAILMVVKKEDLSRIKDIIKKLDVPNKMVQIDVLLVERRVKDSKQTGVNILKFGSNDVKKHSEVSFDADKKKGLLDFLISRSNNKYFPSFDLTLSLLMSQEDMHIYASPSTLAVNQTPAKISIVDEISITDSTRNKDGAVENTYSRDKFGIIIDVTPTIHASDDDEKEGFVTLQTNVEFDTAESLSHDKPRVTKRYIENEVRVADGETIILGGLRRNKKEEDSKKIPFLGEIPGIGKLFGTTKAEDDSNEMFIFITPRIIKAPIEGLRKTRQEMLEKRIGDTSDFLDQLETAKAKEKAKLFENSLKLLFDS